MFFALVMMQTSRSLTDVFHGLATPVPSSYQVDHDWYCPDEAGHATYHAVPQPVARRVGLVSSALDHDLVVDRQHRDRARTASAGLPEQRQRRLEAVGRGALD